ncbi:hypothetical protein D3C72_1201780 [compost metagenome]
MAFFNKASNFGSLKKVSVFNGIKVSLDASFLCASKFSGSFAASSFVLTFGAEQAVKSKTPVITTALLVVLRKCISVFLY